MNIVKITDFMSEKLINLELKSNTKEEVLKELKELLNGSINILDADKCYEGLVAREKIGSTGIGKGVAIPHTKTDFVTKLTVGFGISREGIDFDSLDNEKTHMFFVFASPIKDSQTYLKVLARISRLIRNKEFRNRLLSANTPNEIIELINKEEE
ncbi:PTS sugar transporter subunit IIA [Haliovirga abyssi]|uniref:PTS sugar transporter subunit IIA n=1 Tax=Haliovirga abyssi TaxID=2996794 RepID=A0AAU9D3D6_9FUSO|nr:PTS sugar transporter subunit IIA [Haliovirga abyssi]BDU50494.1 PTS sugar transporter subunit IIA [Haliovirga abyssi]